MFLRRSESLVYNDKITMPTITTMTITVVIETINKFLNLTGYCRPDLSDTKTVYAPCSKLDSVLGECMRHACVIRQCASFNGAHAFVLHFAELTVDFLFMKTCYQCLIYIFVFLRVVIGK